MKVGEIYGTKGYHRSEPTRRAYAAWVYSPMRLRQVIL